MATVDDVPRSARVQRRIAVSAMPPLLGAVREFVPRTIDKTDEQREELARGVQGSHLFSAMDSDDQAVIVNAMGRSEFSAGRDILVQGEESAARFYLITEGLVAVVKGGKNIASMGRGRTFGELEMMYDTLAPNAATIRAVTDVVVYWLDRATYQNIVLKVTMAKRDLYLKMLEGVSFLGDMTNYDKATLADVLQRDDYQPGDTIIRLGEQSVWMHFIVTGRVKVVGRDESGRKKDVIELGVGEPVGELEFLFNHAAVADVVAVTHVRTAKMNRKHFEMCMGPITDNLKRFVAKGRYEYYITHADVGVRNAINEAEKKDADVKRGTEAVVFSCDPHGELMLVDTVAGKGARGRATQHPYRFTLAPFQASHIALIGLREDGTIVYWNDALAHLTQHAGRDVVGQSVYSLVHSSSQKCIHDAVSAAAAAAGNAEAFQKQQDACTVTIARSDGLTSVTINFRFNPSHTARSDDSPEVVLGVGVEIRQRPQSRELDSGQWLADQMRSAVESGDCAPERMRELLETFERVKKRAEIMSTDTLHSVNSRQLVGSVTSQLQANALTRATVIRIDFGERMPESFFCDTQIVPQTLTYALSNCVKHSNESDINIKCNLVTDAGLDFIEFSFEDFGPGIDAAVLQAFMKPTPANEHLAGSLLKVRSGVASIGGTVVVQSEPNHTCVVIRIPYIPAEDSSDDAPSALVSPGAEGDAARRHQFTTLVVEERAADRNQICTTLWGRRHAVVPAMTGPDVRKLVDAADILIIDPQQTILGEADVIAFLRSVERRVTVVVTGESLDDNTREAFHRAGFLTLVKPLNAMQALATLRKAEEHVGKRKAESERIAQMRETFSRTNHGAWKRGALLGKGSFGAVYEAVDVLTGGKMAVKSMRLTQKMNRQELIGEIETMCTLQHPNIIHYFYCEDVAAEERLDVFMEIATGGSLQDRVLKHGAMDMMAAVAILRDVVEGIRYIHSKRIVHCDLKTGNVMFGQDGKAKIGDFGTAKRLPQEGDKLYAMAGTLQYMSPECMGADPETKVGFDFSADIWSLGCIVMEMFTAKAPWSHVGPAASGMGLVQYVSKLSETTGPDLSVLFDQPAQVFEFVRACLEVNPASRPTAAQLLDFPLLREGGDRDTARALRVLQRAQLLHTLNNFVAFREVDVYRDAAPPSAHGHDDTASEGGFFSSDDDGDDAGPVLPRQVATARCRGGSVDNFFDSDAESAGVSRTPQPVASPRQMPAPAAVVAWSDAAAAQHAIPSGVRGRFMRRPARTDGGDGHDHEQAAIALHDAVLTLLDRVKSTCGVSIGDVKDALRDQYDDMTSTRESHDDKFHPDVVKLLRHDAALVSSVAHRFPHA